MKTFFEFVRPYRFEVTDLTAIIYSVCAILGIVGGNPGLLFLIGSVVSTAFCWQARRINVMVLNIALLTFNIHSFSF